MTLCECKFDRESSHSQVGTDKDAKLSYEATATDISFESGEFSKAVESRRFLVESSAKVKNPPRLSIQVAQCRYDLTLMLER